MLTRRKGIAIQNKKNQCKWSNHFIIFLNDSIFQIHSTYFTISHSIYFAFWTVPFRYSLQYVMVRSILNLFNLWTNAIAFIIHSFFILSLVPTFLSRQFLSYFTFVETHLTHSHTEFRITSIKYHSRMENQRETGAIQIMTRSYIISLLQLHFNIIPSRSCLTID